MEVACKYRFDWTLLGNLEDGRPNLGASLRLEVYRLMQFCFRDVIESHYGTKACDAIFYDAGKLAGTHYYEQVLSHISDFDDFIAYLQKNFKEMGIGILRVEESDLENGKLVLTVSEDLDCSGLPDIDSQLCIYDEGFICALIENFTGKPFLVKEIDCWGTGDRTCRFTAQVIEPSESWQ